MNAEKFIQIGRKSKQMESIAQKIVLDKDQHVSRLQTQIKIDKSQIEIENLGQQTIRIDSLEQNLQMQKGEKQILGLQTIKIIFGSGEYQIEFNLQENNPLLLNSPVVQKQVYIDESQVVPMSPKILVDSKVCSLLPKPTNSSTTEQITINENSRQQSIIHPLAQSHNEIYESPQEDNQSSDYNISTNSRQGILSAQIPDKKNQKSKKQKCKLQNQLTEDQNDDISSYEQKQNDNIQVIDDTNIQEEIKFQDINKLQSNDDKNILTIKSNEFHTTNPTIIIPKIIKKYQYNFEQLSMELDITNKSVFVSGDINNQQRRVLQQFNCTIVENISKINDVVCMFAPQISRSARMLTSIIVGIPIFNSNSLLYQSTVKASKQENTPYKLSLLKPKVSEINQLFNEDRQFNLKQFDLPSLSKHYCTTRLICSIKNIIVPASALQYDLDHCESDCNTFAFLFYLTQLGLNVHFIYDQQYDYKVSSVLQQSSNNRHIKCHREISGTEDQKLEIFINKKVKDKSQYLFLVTDWYLANQKNTYGLQTITKLNLIEAAFINDIIC